MNRRKHPTARSIAAGVTLVLLLAACGGGGSQGSAEQDSSAGGSDQQQAGGGEGDAPRAAILLPGNVTDQGFNATGAALAEQFEAEFGGEAAFTETVSVPDQADVYRQFANQGYGLVIGWGGQFTDGAVAVAEEFPDVNFLVASSSAENGANMASFDTAIEQWQYVVGYVMGKLTETGVVGQVSGQCFPSTAANINGTEQGVLAANPDATFLETFTGDFNDPTAARDAATAMIEQGADVLTTNLNDAQFGVFEAAQAAEGEVLVVGEWLEDLNTAAPDAIVASSNKTYVPFAMEMAATHVAGTWEGENRRFDMPPSSEWGPAIFDTDLLDDALHEESIEIQDQIANGEIEVERDETCP
jgi:basic membrane protein A